MGLKSVLVVLGLACLPAMAQDEKAAGQPAGQPTGQPSGPPGGQPQFFRGPGGPMGQERQLVKQFDTDKNGRLDKTERAAAREFVKANPLGRRGGPRRGPGGGPADAGNPGGPAGQGAGGGQGGGPGGAGPRMVNPGGGMGGREPGRPGPKVEVSEAATFKGAGLFAPEALRTFFLEFESEDWEAELADFYGTDVEVPAALTVDGVKYPGVGVHFRGASSFFMVPAGSKRSLNISMDFTNPKQRLYGHRTLNLLNSNGDASFMSSVLYAHLARPHIPAPRANFAKVVVNGESWGLYVSVEQFNQDFADQNFPKAKGAKGNGARWKVKGSPGGRSGLEYTGDNLADYKGKYQIRSKDDDKDWLDLINLCRVLNETPLEQLEEALAPILDIDGVLWFLALDNVLANSDGYWTRASDFSIYKDPSGKFHIFPHDMNESFSGALGGPGGPGGGPPGGGPGGGGPRPDGPRDGPDGQPIRPDGEPRPAGGGGGARDGGGGGGARRTGTTLDPLIGLDDDSKPLRSRLLSVPSLRETYLRHVGVLADELDWDRLGPVVARYRALIEDEVRADTRKLTSFAAFERATADEAPDAAAPGRPGLRAFADGRRKYLLEHPGVAQTKEPAR